MSARKIGFGHVPSLLKIAFRSPRAPVSVLTIVFFCVSASSVFVEANIGKIIGSFYKALVDRDNAAFVYAIRRASVVLLFLALAKASKAFLLELVKISWRRHLSLSLHHEYLSELVFYKVVHAFRRKKSGLSSHLDLDNPDQRMTQDVDRFCDNLGSVMSQGASAPLVVFLYTFYTFRILGIGAICAVYVFFLIGLMINRLLVSPIIPLVCRLEECEGDFRHAHVHIRKNVEPIAFNSGHVWEKRLVNRVLGYLLEVRYKIARRKLVLNVSLGIFEYFGSILNYIILGVMVMHGSFLSRLSPDERAAVIPETSFYVLMLINGVTYLVETFTTAGDMAGCGQRVFDLLTQSADARLPAAVNQKDAGAGPAVLSEQSLLLPKNPTVQLEHVAGSARGTGSHVGDHCFVSVSSADIHAPDRTGRLLIKALSLKIGPSARLAILGPSGAGKTSVLRAICGLFPVGPGGTCVSKLTLGRDMLALSGWGHFPLAGIMEQILYPAVSTLDKVGLARLQDCLEAVGLRRLAALLGQQGDSDVAGYPSLVDFRQRLSSGEQQRLQFARLLFARPRLVLLDEATNAVDSACERRLYALLGQLGCAVVSVTHRTSVMNWHDTFLYIAGDAQGSWSLTSSPPSDTAVADA